MNRPDSNASDPSANQDDAVWLDLVARLQGDTHAPGSGAAPEDSAGPQAGGGATAANDGERGAGPEHGRAKRFTDFDPLGLAAGAPTELSAAERQAAAARQRDAQAGDTAGPPAAEGPRDYGVEDDDGAFVPEEPPSLSATDPLTMLAGVGAVGAPVALVLSAMFWRSAPLLAILGMVATFIGAVVYLIMKLPQEKDENDDGARV